MNDTHDFATNYRGLLVAKITAVHTPTTGPLEGRRVYEWIEQTFDPADGAEIDALPPREGVYTSPTEFWNCLLDPNDADIPVGNFVWARMKGAVTGITVYEMVASAGGGDAGFWAALTAKTTDACPAYSFTEVATNDSPEDNAWTAVGGGRTGTAYEVNCVDLPATAIANGPVIVRIFTDEDGDYYFEMNPRWEFVKPTGAPSGGYYPGVLITFDSTGLPSNSEAILILDLNT